MEVGPSNPDYNLLGCELAEYEQTGGGQGQVTQRRSPPTQSARYLMRIAAIFWSPISSTTNVQRLVQPVVNAIALFQAYLIWEIPIKSYPR